MHEYFSLFGLPERFAIDPAQLDVAYRHVQAQVHPDRFVNHSEAERRVAMQWATLANEAFRTLKNPLARARYLLERRGVEVDAERNTGMSNAFLMQQMEWREAVEEAADDAEALKRLERDLARDERVMLDDVKDALDEEGDLVQAVELVRRLMFMEKLRREIDDALAQLEN
ncbi:MAG: hscB [Proteobacteria bacterium]|jgi:molecular chaperone HscB|nr:hscB [Pseudomonadota bacterium]